MSEDTKVVPAGEPTVAEPEKTQAEKKFSQAELDYHINARLEREKASSKKLLDAKDQELASLKMEYETSTTVVSTYKDTLTKLLAKQIEPLPDDIKTLLAKLDPNEQVEWLNKNGSKYSVKGIPAVPDGKAEGITSEELIQRKRQSGIY